MYKILFSMLPINAPLLNLTQGLNYVGFKKSLKTMIAQTILCEIKPLPQSTGIILCTKPFVKATNKCALTQCNAGFELHWVQKVFKNNDRSDNII